MIVHIDLVPAAGLAESENHLINMARKLSSDKSSVATKVDMEEGRIITSFRFRDITQGAAASLLHRELKLALWEGWEDLCIRFS